MWFFKLWPCDLWDFKQNIVQSLIIVPFLQCFLFLMCSSFHRSTNACLYYEWETSQQIHSIHTQKHQGWSRCHSNWWHDHTCQTWKASCGSLSMSSPVKTRFRVPDLKIKAIPWSVLFKRLHYLWEKKTRGTASCI